VKGKGRGGHRTRIYFLLGTDSGREYFYIHTQERVCLIFFCKKLWVLTHVRANLLPVIFLIDKDVLMAWCTITCVASRYMGCAAWKRLPAEFFRSEFPIKTDALLYDPKRWLFLQFKEPGPF
jgi:hypothetical protein